jgi:hypothetical protein
MNIINTTQAMATFAGSHANPYEGMRLMDVEWDAAHLAGLRDILDEVAARIDNTAGKLHRDDAAVALSNHLEDMRGTVAMQLQDAEEEIGNRRG